MSDEKKMPKVEDKTACEVCGKMVTVMPAGRAAHMRTHKSAEKEEVKPAIESTEKTPAKVDVSKLKEEERVIMERALAAQENFRKAPEVFMSEDSQDENMALVRLYAPHCLDEFDQAGELVKRAQGHAFFANASKLVNWASRGYVPVLSETSGYVTNSGGDVLTVCDRKLYEARERQTQDESRKMVREVKKDLNKTKVDGVDAGDQSDLRDTSLKVGTETIQV